MHYQINASLGFLFEDHQGLHVGFHQALTVALYLFKITKTVKSQIHASCSQFRREELKRMKWKMQVLTC